MSAGAGGAPPARRERGAGSAGTEELPPPPRLPLLCLTPRWGATGSPGTSSSGIVIRVATKTKAFGARLGRGAGGFSDGGAPRACGGAEFGAEVAGCPGPCLTLCVPSLPRATCASVPRGSPCAPRARSLRGGGRPAEPAVSGRRGGGRPGGPRRARVEDAAARPRGPCTLGPGARWGAVPSPALAFPSADLVSDAQKLFPASLQFAKSALPPQCFPRRPPFTPFAL